MIDPVDFESFMRSYQNMVFSTAMRLLGREADALDIAQEVFLKAHEHYGQLQGNPSAGGWLKTVATNLSLNHLSRYRARWRFFSELFTSEQGDTLETLLPAPDTKEHEDDEEYRRFYLEKALQKLPAGQRVPLVLYHFDEMSYEEIATKLNISLSKVKTDIHRGRQSLRRWLHPNLAQWDNSSPKRSTPGADTDFFGHPRLVAGY